MFRDKLRHRALRRVAVGALAALVVTATASEAPARRSPFEPLSIFAQALAQIEVSYVEPVEQDELVYGAIRGLTEALDPHSAFLDPKEYEILVSDAEGRFVGVGVEVSTRGGWLTILSVFEGGPAAKAGLQAGDRLLAIDGEDARDLPLHQAVRRIRGEPGTSVQVTIRREGREETLERTLIRAFIDVDPVDLHLLEDRLLYVRMKVFQDGAARRLSDALDEAVVALRKRGGVQGLLLDLRDNGGGLLDEAVAVSDEFLASGVIVSTRGRNGELISEHSARRPGTRPSWPMVVLINENTASAAEIVAGALHDHQRAALVGARSFGKGSVQNIFELPGGSALKLTTARYYTPSGRSIQAEGITPDLLAEQPRAEGGAEPIREEGLEGHLTAPAGAQKPKVRSSRRAPEPTGNAPAVLAEDPQALRAYAVLKERIGLR
jgi:carboxyl-terminal processing protease